LTRLTEICFLQDGITALIYAAHGNYLDVLESLLEQSEIDVNIQAEVETIARVVHLHCNTNNTSYVYYQNGDTAVICAVANGCEGAAKLLLDHPDVDVNLQNSVSLVGFYCTTHQYATSYYLFFTHYQVGDSVLIYAVLKKCAEVLPILLQRQDIDVNVQNAVRSITFTIILDVLIADDLRLLNLERAFSFNIGVGEWVCRVGA